MDKIKLRKQELRKEIKEIKRKIEWEPVVSFTRPKLIQDINLLIGELKGINFATCNTGNSSKGDKA